MHRRLPIVLSRLLAFGMLASLPACAQPPGDQVIGPEPKIGCCWGSAPDPDSPAVSRVIEISIPAVAEAPLPPEDWINRAGED